MERNTRRANIIVFFLISLLISASTAAAINRQEKLNLPLEVVTSDKVFLKNVRIIDKDGCIQVKGSVKPRKNSSPGMVGHVDVELLDREGHSIENFRVSHTPAFLHPKGNKRSYFTYTLGEKAQNCSKVRVSYHYTRNAGKKVCSSNH